MAAPLKSVALFGWTSRTCLRPALYTPPFRKFPLVYVCQKLRNQFTYVKVMSKDKVRHSIDEYVHTMALVQLVSCSTLQQMEPRICQTKTNACGCQLLFYAAKPQQNWQSGRAVINADWSGWGTSFSCYESRRLSDVPTCFLGLTIFSRASCRPLSLWSYVHACCSGNLCNSQNV